jgi:hypothetical protein
MQIWATSLYSIRSEITVPPRATVWPYTAASCSRTLPPNSRCHRPASLTLCTSALVPADKRSLSIDLVWDHATCCGYLYAIQERRLPRSRLLGASRKPSGSSTRPRCVRDRLRRWVPQRATLQRCLSRDASAFAFVVPRLLRLPWQSHISINFDAEVSVAEHVGSRDRPTDCISRSSRDHISH